MNRLKYHILPIVLLLIAAAIAIGAITIVGVKTSFDPNIALNLKMGSNFEQQNATTIRSDSFAALASRAYGGVLSHNKVGDTLQIILSDPNQLGSDFYNSNGKLLKMDLISNGFSIRTQDKTVTARFIIKDQAVVVPNDVLIKMLDKTLNK